MNAKENTPDVFLPAQAAITALDGAKDRWAQTSIADRLVILQEIKDALINIAPGWVAAATRAKQLPADSPLQGEEWLSGPYALMGACNGLMQTLSQMEGKAFLKSLPKRKLATGQTAVKVTPHSIWDQLLLSGVKAEIWMQPGINEENLSAHAASLYDSPLNDRKGKVSLVLGAGNIAAIAPLDAFQKLFVENQVVILKMNPVNDYLTEYLNAALRPLIDRDALRIVKGGGDVGAWLTENPVVEEIHITGAESTHDAIIWGTGEEGRANREAGTPRLNKRITSELGAVCPTIVVPGNWSDADIRFQAEHLATQKLHNSGFNCVACQALLMPRGWKQGEALIQEMQKVMQSSQRLAYYPGAEDRLENFRSHGSQISSVARGKAPDAVFTRLEDDAWFCERSSHRPCPLMSWMPRMPSST